MMHAIRPLTCWNRVKIGPMKPATALQHSKMSQLTFKYILRFFPLPWTGVIHKLYIRIKSDSRDRVIRNRRLDLLRCVRGCIVIFVKGSRIFLVIGFLIDDVDDRLNLKVWFDCECTKHWTGVG